MNAIIFTIKLEQPLLVTQLGSGDENSAVSLSYIPGSVLRGALARSYIERYGIQDAAADPTCRRLFFNGDVYVLDCYPLDHSGKRSLPTPLSWYADKENLANWNKDRKAPPLLQIYDAAVDASTISELKDPKPLFASDSFCHINDDASVEFIKRKRRISIHIQREHQRKLKTKDDTQVYSYEAIADGEQLAGVILVPDAQVVNDVYELLHDVPELHIGGSHTAGYGHVYLSDVGISPGWQEYRPEGELEEPITIITLLSDTVIVDKFGQYSDDISQAIGATNKPLRCYRRMKIVGGFNRKWGLPLPQAYALQAGSVFVYSSSDLNTERIKRYIDTGIGERRRDGFGRIAVNWLTCDERQAGAYNDELPVSSPPILKAPAARAVAQRIVDNHLRRRLDAKLYNAVLDLSIQGKPSNSVLMRVRLAAREAMFKQDIAPVQLLLQDVQDKAAGKSLKDARLNKDTLYEWLWRLTMDKDVESSLRLDAEVTKPLQIGDIRAYLTEQLRAEYAARLIDGVIKKKIQEQREAKK